MIILLLIGLVCGIQTTGYSKRWLDEPHVMILSNDPANSIRIQSCPVIEGHQLTPLLQSLGYLEENCKGYTHYYLSSNTLNNLQQELERFNEMILNKVSTFDEFYKLRVVDTYEIKLTADNRIVEINAVFAHPREGYHNSTANRKEHHGNFTRSLIGRGLHQQLQYHFMLPRHLDIHDQCVLTISTTTTHEYYIDVDEFANISYFETIDVEKPSFLNKQYYWRWSVHVSQLTKLDSAYNLTHRLHFRYQAASTNEYQRVIIPRDTTAQFRCPEGTYRFQDIQQSVLVTNVPVGNKNNERTVVFMTLVVTICSSMFISKAIKQRKLVS